ncbi:MAG: 30S ribosomal protein S6 [Puniceicoccales bacterium]|jgi:small subunit ribosomal protein S6|nr:30S ribosomal protein S6 [Puniceicoccales bacterium]
MTANKTNSSYRATIILDLRGTTDPVETITNRLKSTLTSIGATTTSESSLGQKNFIRVTDRKNPNGIYIQIHFDGPASAPSAFREKLRLDRSIKRLLIQSA